MMRIEQMHLTTEDLVVTATSADNTLRAAITGKQIFVLGWVLIGDGVGTYRFEAGTGGTALTGVMPIAGAAGSVVPVGITPWLTVAAGSLLNLEVGGGIGVFGVVKIGYYS